MKDRVQLLQVLKDSLYFKGLSENVITEISQIAVVKSFAKGQEIFGEGDKALGFYLILEGLVKIYKLSSKGKEQIIHILGVGDIFAEIVLAGIERYPAYAQALTKCKVAFFERLSFLKLIQNKPELALSIIGLFALKLRSLLKSIDTLTLKEARERLITYLWELSDEGKKESFSLEVNKSHLALLLGITPETLSRLFQKFKEEGLLEIKQRRIRLLNLPQWRSLLQQF